MGQNNNFTADLFISKAMMLWHNPLSDAPSPVVFKTDHGTDGFVFTDTVNGKKYIYDQASKLVIKISLDNWSIEIHHVR